MNVKGSASALFDQQRIEHAHEDPLFVQRERYHLVVTTGRLHYDPGIFVDRRNVGHHQAELLASVRIVVGRYVNFTRNRRAASMHFAFETSISMAFISVLIKD